MCPSTELRLIALRNLQYGTSAIQNTLCQIRAAGFSLLDLNAKLNVLVPSMLQLLLRMVMFIPASYHVLKHFCSPCNDSNLLDSINLDWNSTATKPLIFQSCDVTASDQCLFFVKLRFKIISKDNILKVIKMFLEYF